MMTDIPRAVAIDRRNPLPASRYRATHVWMCGILACLLTVAPDAGTAVKSSWLPLLGSTVLGGVLLGAVNWLLRAATIWLRPWWGPVIGSALGGLGAVWTITELNVPVKLTGPHRDLAWLVVWASLSGLGALGALLGWLQPSSMHPYGRIAGFPFSRRVAAASGLLAIAGILLAFDARMFVGSYPEAHAILRLAALPFLVQGLCLIPSIEIVERHSTVLRTSSVGTGIAGLLCLVFFAAADSATPTLTGSYAPLYFDFVRTMTDVDRDGASALLNGDCNDLDPRVRRGVPEIPGNGIDENCTLGDGDPEPGLQRLAQPPLSSTPPAGGFVLIVIDSLRADRTSMYGYQASTTPQLQAWATQARIFEHAYSAGGWTGIALPTMMLGVWSRRIQWTELYYTLPHFRFLAVGSNPPLLTGERTKEILTFAVDDRALTLAELLRRRGMQTLAVVDDGWGEYIARDNFSRGFQQFVETDTLPEGSRDDAGTVDLALNALATIPNEQPFFLWLHVYGVHGPNTYHPELGPPGRNEAERYDHEVRFMDRELGRFLAALDVRADAEQLTVIVSGDHGERFTSETSRTHGYQLEAEDVRVPLLIRGPGILPARIETPASTADIAPTILAATQTPGTAGLNGRDLRTLPVNEPRIVMSDTWRYTGAARRTLDLAAAFDQRLEAVRDLQTNQSWVLVQATGEMLPAATDPDARALVHALDEYLEQTTPLAAAPPM
jgi:arylsulfatase A-like enzyme